MSVVSTWNERLLLPYCLSANFVWWFKTSQKCVCAQSLAKFCLAAMLFSVTDFNKRKKKERKTDIFIRKKCVRLTGKSNIPFIFFFAASFACVLWVCIYTYMCVCVSVNFPSYMQKERMHLVVVCKALLGVLTARLANNDLYAPACIKYALLVHACWMNTLPVLSLRASRLVAIKVLGLSV